MVVMGKFLLQTLAVSLGVLSLLPASVVASPIVQAAADPTADEIAAQALKNAYEVLNGTLSDGMTHTSCTKDKLQVRKE